MTANKPQFANLIFEMGWWSEKDGLWGIGDFYDEVSFVYITSYYQVVCYCTYIESLKVS